MVKVFARKEPAPFWSSRPILDISGLQLYLLGNNREVGIFRNYVRLFKMVSRRQLIDKETEEILCLSLLTKKKRKRRWNVHPLHATRHRDGECIALVKQMRAMDEEMHFGYFRMSAHRFDDLAQRIEPFLQHKRHT